MAEATKTVGRFEIVERIGRGGMAVVYLARQPGLDRVVALKELRRFDDEADSTLAERFLREARMAGSLSHPNIVVVFDYFEEDGTPYIAMEYMERGSLRPRIGTLTLPQIGGVLEGLLSGLSHAEERGIVHRDLKPENLLIGADGGIKLADLGIAKAFNQVSMGLTKSGMAIGTPTYMAPEQATAKGVGPSTDLYATGVIAYELLVGRVPFIEVDTPLSILWQHVHDPVPPPRELKPDLDPRISAWLERMLAKTPEERPRSARRAWRDLEEILVDLLGWRWRQEASLVELARERSHEVERVVEIAPTPTDGFETYDPRPAGPGAAVESPAAPSEIPLEDVSPVLDEVEEREQAETPPELAPTAPAVTPPAAETRDRSFEFPRGIEGDHRWRPSRRLGLIAAALVLVGVLALVAGLALRGGGEPQPPPPPPPLPDPHPSPSERVGLSLSGSRLFVAAPRGRVAALNGITLARLTALTDAARPAAIGGRGSTVWLADEGSLVRLSRDLRALAVTASLRAPRLAGSPGGPLAVSGSTKRGRGRVCVLGSRSIGRCANLGFTPSGLGTAQGRVFVADAASDVVMQLRLRRAGLVADPPIRLPSGSRPHGSLVVSDGRMYVAVERGIAVIDLAGGAPPRTIRLPTTPADLWVVPFNGRLFAPLYAQDRVALLDLTAERPRPRLLPTGRRPVAVVGGTASSLGGNAVYVAGAGAITRHDALSGRKLGVARVRALVGGRLAPVVVRSVRFEKRDRTVTARIELTGGRLEPDGLRILNSTIADGTARLELWQGGIGMKVGRADTDRVTLRLRREPGRIAIRIASAAGAFIRMTAKLVAGGQAVVLTLTQPPPVIEKKSDSGTDRRLPPDDGDSVPQKRHPTGCAAPPPGPEYLCVNNRWVRIETG